MTDQSTNNPDVCCSATTAEQVATSTRSQNQHLLDHGVVGDLQMRARGHIVHSVNMLCKPAQHSAPRDRLRTRLATNRLTGGSPPLPRKAPVLLGVRATSQYSRTPITPRLQSPDSHNRPPKLGYCSFQLEYWPPKLGLVPPKLGHWPLKLGHCSSKLGFRPPKLGYRSPKLGYWPPKLGYCSPKLGFVPSKLGLGAP